MNQTKRDTGPSQPDKFLTGAHIFAYERRRKELERP